MSLYEAVQRLRGPGNLWPNYNKQYRFTKDWFTPRIPKWKKHLAKFKGRPGLRALEIGLYEGRSSLWLLENILTAPDARLTGIDSFGHAEPIHQRFLQNLVISGLEDKMDLRHGFSQDILPSLVPGSFDLIHVDGNHVAPFVETDMRLSWPLLKPGGYLIFDDYQWGAGLPEAQRPRHTIQAFLQAHQGEYRTAFQGYQIILEKVSP